MSEKENAALQEVKSMLSKHMLDSEKRSGQLFTAINGLTTHHTYTVKALEADRKDIDELKAGHDRAKGAIWLFGIIGGAGFLSGLVSVVLHLLAR